MDPGLEQERINGTFRWTKRHADSCPFLRTGLACCLPTCAQGSSAAVTTVVGWVWMVLALLVCSLMCTGLRLRRCAYHWTRPVGGGRRGHYLCGSLGVHWSGQTYALHDLDTGYCSMNKNLHMLALVEQPSLHGYNAYMVCRVKERCTRGKLQAHFM